MAVRRGAGRIRHIATPTLSVHNHTQASSKSRKSLESRTNPADLRTEHFDEHWRDVIAAFVKEGLESHCEQKCKNSRSPIQKFSLLTMQVKWTLSLKWKWSRNSIDLESSDAAKLKQLRDQMVQTHRESPRSTTQTEPEQTATECYQTVRCQSDHDNVEHNFGQDCTELFADFSIFAQF